MPRTTRAALRSKELTDEETIAASVPLPNTPQKERVPLGEIADNKGAESNMVESAENKPAKQASRKGRKAKGAKKNNTKEKNSNTQILEAEVLEDDVQSSSSSAADEAREMLLDAQGTNGTNNALPPANPILRLDPSPVTMVDSQALFPATDTASEKTHVTAMSKIDGETEDATAGDASLDSTKQSDPQVCESNIEIPVMPDAKETPDVNFEVRPGNEAATEDSFVEQINSRSPAKRTSRFEDSVEALDKLEDDIEKAGQAITPPPTDALPISSMEKSAVKAKKTGRDAIKANQKEVSRVNGTTVEGANASLNVPPRSSSANKVVKRTSIKRGPMDIKPKENRASLLRQGIKPTPQSRVTSAPTKRTDLAKKSPADPNKVGISTSKKSAPPARRVSSVTKPPFQPAKSSKAPTRSTFELPGEAVSRKLKEQREERLKKDEEERSKKQTFKARPVRLSQAPEVRMTAATKARLSIARQPPGQASQTSTKRLSPLSSSVSSLSTKTNNKRLSTLSTANRSSSPAIKSTTAKRVPSRSSVSGEPRAALTADDLANAKVRGKEAFARPKNEIAAREKERREKEDAAKRARIEAAERGRVASREWAERQKVKKAAAMVTAAGVAVESA